MLGDVTEQPFIYPAKTLTWQRAIFKAKQQTLVSVVEFEKLLQTAARAKAVLSEQGCFSTGSGRAARQAGQTSGTDRMGEGLVSGGFDGGTSRLLGS